MSNDALKEALSRIAAAATDALAALPGDDEPEPETVDVPAVIEHDYHGEELERIEANADATVKVIEAEAAAAVAVIEAQADKAGDVLDQLATDPIGTVDDAVDDAIDDNPIMDETLTPADEPGDLADVGEAIEESGDLLDALPVLTPDEIPGDNPPSPADWYRRRRWSRR